MNKRIMAVGNGDELHEVVNGRVYRHVYDERSGRYITLNEDAASSYAANCRRERVTARGLMGNILDSLGAHNEAAIAEHAQPDRPVRKTDLEMTQDAASNRWGY